MPDTIAARTGPHPVDDVKFTRPLVKALRRHVDAVAASLTELPADQRRACAVAWVFTSCAVAWAEDHGLIDPSLRPAAEPLRRRLLSASGASPVDWLARACADLAVHPSTVCLIDPKWSPITAALPSDETCSDLLDWWAGDAPSLSYESTDGPASISGWIVGDLLQALADEQVKGNALVQTPWWVADFIIDRTLIPAARDFRDETLMTIDPTCGTGHFLLRKIDYLWELYTTGALAGRQSKDVGVTGWTPVAPAEAIRRIVAGVTGVELDPLTAAVARLRMVVAIGDLMHRSGLLSGSLRLDTIPHTVRPRVSVGDSLIAGSIPWDEYARLHPRHAAIYGLDPTVPTVAAPAAQVDEQLDLFSLLNPDGAVSA